MCVCALPFWDPVTYVNEPGIECNHNRQHINCGYVWSVTFVYEGFICIPKSIFYSRMCVSGALLCHHWCSHVQILKACSTCYEAATLCYLQIWPFRISHAVEWMMRRDQTGWIIRVSDCLCPPKLRVKYCFCVILHAVWEICWLSLALYWMAADRFALGEKCGEESLSHCSRGTKQAERGACPCITIQHTLARMESGGAGCHAPVMEVISQNY